MGHHPHQDASADDVPARIQPAIEALKEARSYAEQTSGDRWEFAVEAEQLIEMGLKLNDFRWLVRKGLVEHQLEITLEGDRGRTFRPTGELVFPKGTCFVLAHDEATIDINQKTDIVGSISQGNGRHQANSPPHWDCDARELSVDGKLVKRFKWSALNQEMVLCAFEEEGWPRRIDDPLPPHPDQDPKRRLSDTIKCLNRKQFRPLIRFHGDGTGQGVSWERVGQNRSQRTEDSPDF